MTRRQKQFMDRMTMTPPPPASVPRKRQRRGSTVEPEDDDVSDTASVASSKTNTSARSRKSIDPSTPVRQSKRLLVRFSFFQFVKFNCADDIFFSFVRRKRNPLRRKVMQAKIRTQNLWLQLQSQPGVGVPFQRNKIYFEYRKLKEEFIMFVDSVIV